MYVYMIRNTVYRNKKTTLDTSFILCMFTSVNTYRFKKALSFKFITKHFNTVWLSGARKKKGEKKIKGIICSGSTLYDIIVSCKMHQILT